ncbi:I78 family peptidase inhibitor [Rhodobacter maris]|uniref:Peptidase inhibitor I78 family protein n=1 Tax=Rhodobacter maris TaxID=446682 RepID=A0A285SCP4_9RHOB|nr:I78 family peptidase inhibitor [Rhodobacter maris]SOC05348.1 peptidase inhibitor I78 family protein [Rhodobacter maris]
MILTVSRFAPLPVAALLALGACASSQEESLPEQPLPVPHMTPAVSQDGALEAREPDTCHAVEYTSALGQPSSVIPTLGITRPINVVEWRGIEPQEYNPQRIVFRLDAAGNIFNIDCG